MSTYLAVLREPLLGEKGVTANEEDGLLLVFVGEQVQTSNGQVPLATLSCLTY